MNLYQTLFPADKATHLWILIDPDAAPLDELLNAVNYAEVEGAHAILIGGSFLIVDDFDDIVKHIKHNTSLPVILFPGGQHQLSRYADGILFMSLMSGRNPQFLVAEQVQAAPRVRRMKLQSISTAYLLIESGRTTSAEFVSNTRPIPRNKPMLVAAHAMTAELFGMQTVYLEAGSGAQSPVPTEVIQAVRHSISVPIIVGGGITSAETAVAAANAGADAIVIGTAVEKKGHRIIREITSVLRGNI